MIIRWVDHLLDDIGPELREKAERHLLDRAAEHDAKALNKLGKHLFEVIDPTYQTTYHPNGNVEFHRRT